MPKLDTVISFFIQLVLTALLLVGLLHFVLPANTPHNFVQIDVEKIFASHKTLINKAVASDFDAALSLTNASDKINSAVSSVAGDRLVFISASIVHGDVLDITDDVLLALGLPTQVQFERVVDVELGMDLDGINELKDFDPAEMFERFRANEKAYNERKEREAAEEKLRQRVP